MQIQAHATQRKGRWPSREALFAHTFLTGFSSFYSPAGPQAAENV